LKEVQRLSHDTVPKYYRIGQDIVRRIQSGQFVVGQQIPSENEIIDAYNVSNTTARKALHEIETEGWVRRVKGKGTFVSRSSVDRSITRILSFTKNMLETGRSPSSRVLSVRTLSGSHSVTVHGRQYVMRGPYVVMERLRLADGVPMMKETRHISASFCPGIEQKDLEGSLYEIYEHEYGVTLERVSQMVSAIILEANQTTVFGVTTAIPAFLVEGVTFCGKELIVEMEESIYRGDMYKFYVEAT
jgi:GntR family transcriptional regulator